MSAPHPPAPGPEHPPRIGTWTERARGSLWGFVRSLVITSLAFSAVAVAGAFVWHQVVVPAVGTKQGNALGMGEDQLARIFAADGWFILISAVCGLVLGIVVELLRRGNAVSRVVVVAAAGLLAAWVMARVGLWLGPPDPKTVLPSLADGATAPLQLTVRSHSAYLVWPFASVAGLLSVLLLRPQHETPEAAEGNETGMSDVGPAGTYRPYGT